jgi:cytosine/adenosine deaminase-related metal-dependent hydrolase
MPISAPVITGGALAVEDDRIVAIGTLSELKVSHPAEIVDFPGCVIIPGLVNAHTHLDLTHFPAWKIRKGIDYTPRTYVDWVVQVIKIRRALTAQEVELSIKDGLRKSLESGTTLTGDILADSNHLPLYETSPLGGRLFFEAIGQDPLAGKAMLDRLHQTISDFNVAGFEPGISPHAPHTVSDQLSRELFQFASARNLPRAIHLAESNAESLFMHDSTGPIADQLYPLVHWEEYLPHPRRASSVAHLDSLGVLDARTLAIHCVHVTPADVETLYRREVKIVLCPRSNARLAVGQAPQQLFRKNRIPLAIGTDSLASNESLSLWDEMRFLLNESNNQFTPDELLAMATLGGAVALGMGKQAGSLQPGKRGDFLVMEPGKATSPTTLCSDLLEESRIRGVYVAGMPVIDNL